MEELIFNVSDTHFFFNDLEVSVILRLFCFGICIMNRLSERCPRTGCVRWDLMAPPSPTTVNNIKVNWHERYEWNMGRWRAYSDIGGQGKQYRVRRSAARWRGGTLNPAVELNVDMERNGSGVMVAHDFPFPFVIRDFRFPRPASPSKDNHVIVVINVAPLNVKSGRGWNATKIFQDK